MPSTNVTEMIGNTPLLELPLKRGDWRLFLKMEKFNPGGSMKDRMALSMIDDAEQKGVLKPGGTIIESSSGNTGIGISIVAAERGYKFIAVVDHHAAKTKIDMMKAYGTEIIHVTGNYADDEVAVKAREELAMQLSKQIPNSIFLQQADNPANARGYYETLGPEIIEQTCGEISALIGSIGTGGSLSGTARYVKEIDPKIEVIGVEPFGSVVFGPPSAHYYQSGTGNPGNVSIGKNVDLNLIDKGLKVGDKEAFNTARFLARAKGIFIGGAAGGVVYSGLDEISKRKDGGNMVAIIADGGEKYIDTVFNDEWMKKKNLIDLIVDERLKELLVLNHNRF